MLNTNKIADSELEVMKIVWEAARPLTASEIFEQINQIFDWDDSTVRTLIRRLTQKKFLNQKKNEKNPDGKREVYFYTPTITEQEYLKEETAGFLKKLYGGSAKTLVANLFKDDLLKKNDIDELKSYWDKEAEKLD